MDIEELVNALYNEESENDIYLVIYDSEGHRLHGFFLGSLNDEYNSLFKKSIVLSEDLISGFILRVVIDKDPRKESDLPHASILSKDKK